MGFTYGPIGAALAAPFPTTVRYTGASMTFNLGGIVGASLAPYIATWLATNYGLGYVGYYLALRRCSLADRHPAVGQRRSLSLKTCRNQLKRPGENPAFLLNHHMRERCGEKPIPSSHPGTAGPRGRA